MNMQRADSACAVCVLFVFGVFYIVMMASLPESRPSEWFYRVELDTVSLLALPIGAWIAARFGCSPVWYLIYGCMYSGLFILLSADQLRDATEARFIWGLTWRCGLPAAIGLWCRHIAIRQAGIARRRAVESGRCVKCDYDLTGNVSGICPECGTAIASTDLRRPFRA